ncbi:MAG TPA: hypothetical protein ENK36_03905 [Desulfobacterales bacterium]|nr:hypothetical protein [Desulfobacterales bacterium]
MLNVYGVRYVIVGGEAVIYYGYARLTGDVDFFYEPTTANVTCLYNALLDFWEGKIPGVKCSAELQTKGTIFQFGVPLNRIDLINSLDAVSFEEAWESRKEEMSQNNGKGYGKMLYSPDDIGDRSCLRQGQRFKKCAGKKR